MLKRIVFTVGLLVVSIGVASDNAPDSSSAARLIESAYGEWVRATNAKDIDWWSSFLAPDAVFLPPGSRPLETDEDIISYYIELFRDPNFGLECAQTSVQVADAGDMAWARGTCKARFSAPNGDLATGSSKWTKVWVRLEDGSWKCRLNTWNYNESG